MPDPENEDHVGKAYYERVNDHMVNIHYLEVDEEASQSGKLVWERAKIDLKHLMGGYTLDVTKYTFPKYVEEMNPEKRKLYGFVKGILNYELTSYMLFSLMESGSLEDSFVELLINHKYYLSEAGIQKLEEGINSGEVVFDIGEVGDGIHYYYDRVDYDRDAEEIVYKRKCFKFEPYRDFYKMDRNTECPELDQNSKSIFNSRDFDSYTFPDELIITKDDVL